MFIKINYFLISANKKKILLPLWINICFVLHYVVSFSEQCMCSDANLFYYEAISIVCDLMDLPIKAIKKNPKLS